jgi:hypothetical protein
MNKDEPACNTLGFEEPQDVGMATIDISSRLEALPNELILHIISFLRPKCITKLQQSSKRLLTVCRDSVFWRESCYEKTQDSHHYSTSTTKFLWKSGQAGTERERFRLTANWDPTFPCENVDWYTEYIQRHGYIAVNWLEQPCIKNGTSRVALGVKGVATYQPGQHLDQLLAISPLEDGSVCLWNVKGAHCQTGSIVSKSRPGILGLDSSRRAIGNDGVTECISVDSIRGRGFFAVEDRVLIDPISQTSCN